MNYIETSYSTENKKKIQPATQCNAAAKEIYQNVCHIGIIRNISRLQRILLHHMFKTRKIEMVAPYANITCM